MEKAFGAPPTTKDQSVIVSQINERASEHYGHQRLTALGFSPERLTGMGWMASISGNDTPAYAIRAGNVEATIVAGGNTLMTTQVWQGGTEEDGTTTIQILDQKPEKGGLTITCQNTEIASIKPFATAEIVLVYNKDGHLNPQETSWNQELANRLWGAVTLEQATVAAIKPKEIIPQIIRDPGRPFFPTNSPPVGIGTPEQSKS